MISDNGGIYAAQDADSEGVEGKFFIWDEDEIKEILNQEESKKIISYFNVTKEGNFEGKNILNKSQSIDPKDEKIVSDSLDKLYEVRSKRIAPNTDKKIITSWNSLAIKSFAYAGILLDREDFILTAVKSMNNLLESNDENKFASFLFPPIE